MEKKVKESVKPYPAGIIAGLLIILAVVYGLKFNMRGIGFLLFGIATALLLADQWQKNRMVEIKNLYTGLLSACEVASSFALVADNLETLETILIAAREIVPSSRRVLLFWVKEERENNQMVYCRAALGVDPSQVKNLTFSLGEKEVFCLQEVFLKSKACEVLDGTKGYQDNDQLFKRLGIRSFLAVPIMVAGKVLGALFLETERKRRHSESEIKTLSFFANQVGIALENVRLYKKVELLSFTDSLTGLCNQRHLQHILNYEWKRSERYQHPLSLVVFDVDFFKNYNDTRGHPAGDDLLVQIAKIMLKNIRATDVAARYGGDEFCVIMPETTKEAAVKKAEKIRVEVEKNTSVTISAGVASFPKDGLNPQELVQKADQALYRSKEAGRNRTTPAC